ncbi:FAD-dependent monooxygenase [Methylobacterium currus]|uniref:FAD-dependent oxidoreductase n=1 Tax=Methylobacterium currus TaxID=2051553 RepID=UPI001E51AA7E|nr:FAD-dependent monooxygenase [Methylobacterium currus]UHC17023.1 FAD-dependent monooxygenase [Methylobacterium currus]
MFAVLARIAVDHERAGNGMGQGSFHVTIIGAGLGGLCLGQALRRRGIAFDIHERDPALTARPQGYRIRIDRVGREALAACLPSNLAALFHQTCAAAGSPGRFLDPQLAPVRGRSVATWHDAAADRFEAEGDLSVHRVTLREILLTGLEDRVRFGHAFARCEPDPGGGLCVQFVDGGAVRTDLLVAADGAGSAVRRQTLTDAEPADTGAVCLYGRVTANAGVTRARALLAGPAVIFADGFAAILDPMTFRPPPVGTAAAGITPVGDYLYAAFIGPRGTIGFGEVLPPPGSALLAERLHALVRAWHPVLRSLLGPTEPASLAVLPIRSAAAIDPGAWPRDVTFLGDAIHVMSPAGGLGANTALADAAHLASRLGEAASGEAALSEALATYADDLHRRAAAAVRASADAAAALFTSAPTLLTTV